ncbi:MAG: wax ester/triacylglycerol synthase family O-acyltransferase [Dehalococcoidia bacterium]|nr:wax ester/triacylglycerol synthase family O-acyltransferase [Dehalococcoidia bacterium]
MSPQDAWFLYFEKPDAPLHIASVAIFDGDIPVEEIRASVDARMHTIPRYRQRALIPPLYAAHPTWEDDPQFSIDRHIREATLPAPGSEAQLMELASDLFAPMLRRDRPLWDITVIRGIAGGRTAYLSRVHHCLVDGVSGIDLLLAVLDLTPQPQVVPPPAEPWQPGRLLDPLRSWSEAMFDQWQSGIRAWRDWQEAAFDPRTQFRRMTELTRAWQVAMPLAFRQARPAPWNKPVGGRRRVAWTSMSFGDVRGIRSVLGGTVNDVMLTLLGGALGRYLRAHEVPTEGQTVRLQIPVNVRSEDERGALGNRVSMMLPEIPVGIEDPVRRLTAVRDEMERLKQEDQAKAFESLMSLAENVPAAWHALAGMGGVPRGAFNFVCTNVPGPLIPLYSVGRRMLAHYPLVPLAGDLGIGVGITSFDKALYVGVMSDPAILSDVDVIAEGFAREFDALRRAAGVEPSDLPDVGVAPANHHGANGHGANGHGANGHGANGRATTGARRRRAARAGS